MHEKALGLAVRIPNVPCGAANIIKQEAIASGIDAIVTKGGVSCSVEKTDIIILGSVRGMKILASRLKRQPFSLSGLAAELEEILKPEKPVIMLRGKEIELDTPAVMGIVNITPDSFSDGGSYMDESAMKHRMEAVAAEGALFIDVGAVSTRPGFADVSIQEEKRRILPAVEMAVEVAKRYGIYVSVDSWRYDVLRECIDMGADLINDQSGLADVRVAALAAESGAGICIMHNNDYGADDLVDRLKSFLCDAAERAAAAGVGKKSIAIDPGFGFVKDVEGNFCVLHYLKELCNLGYPVLAGISRKSMLGSVTGRDVHERNAGTVAAETLAILHGASIIRTHDVGACVDAVKIVEATVR